MRLFNTEPDVVEVRFARDIAFGDHSDAESVMDTAHMRVATPFEREVLVALVQREACRLGTESAVSVRLM